MRRLLASVSLTLAFGAAAAEQACAYSASPPTKGALYTDGQSGRYLLAGSWMYRADRSDVGLAQRWWRTGRAIDGTVLTPPNAYNAGDLSTQSMNGYVGWYRRDFTVPSSAFASYVPAHARSWIVRFDSVNYRADVWLNGHRIGGHTGAYLPFELDLKGLQRGVNRLVVRVDNRRVPSDLPPGPGGGWWNFGGILGEVYLRAVQRADLAQVVISPQLRCPRCAATIHEQALVRNVTGRPQTVRLIGNVGGASVRFGGATIAPGGAWTARGVARVVHPRLWSPDHPALYRARLTLFDNRGRRIGGYVSETGIRKITVTGSGRLTLNGRLLNLRGVNLHEQDLQLGAALDPAHMVRMMGWIRALGATVIRAHYPLNPEIEQLADRYGILIWSEVPVYQVESKYLGQVAWQARALATLRANILTNGNHPSVLLWSIGNELHTPVGAAEASYISAAAALARRADPTRPVGMAVSDWPGVGCQSAYAPLGVIGYNDYFGWFDAGGGATDDRDALGPFLDRFRACYSRQAIFVTEFGFEGNRHGPVEERGTYEFQANSTAYHLGVFASKPWLSGAIYFPLQDFAARPGWGGGDPRPDPPFVHKGPVSLQGTFKPVFGVMAQIYRATTQIGH